MVSAMLALSQVWANKLRSILTTTGIVIGVASVTAVIAVLTGLKKNVLAEFASLGTNKMFIYPQWPGRFSGRGANTRRIQFLPTDFEGMLDHCPSISSFTRVIDSSGKVKSEYTQLETAAIYGIDPSWHEIENRSVTMGRPFTHVDNEQARPVAIIDAQIRDKLGLDRDCVGQSILIDDRTFLVVGLIEPKKERTMFSGGERSQEVYIPFNTCLKLKRPYFTVVATSRSPELSADAQAEATFFLRKTRQISPGERDTFRIEVVERMIEGFNKVADMTTIIASGIVGISLLVGGVGIMNIMLVSVSERTREIGLRKAVGARPSAIMLQFLVESVMLCFVGGAIGVLIGQALTSAVASIPDAKLDRAEIPLDAILMSFGFAGSVGLIFGMFPAIKAARLNPIEALRHE